MTAADFALLMVGICAGILVWELSGWLLEHNRCIAVRDKHDGQGDWGRCDLRRHHDDRLHKLKRGRGADVYWSTAEREPPGAYERFWRSQEQPGRHAATLTDELLNPDNDGDR